MPRRKAQDGLIGDARERAETLAGRRNGLLKMAQDLATRCGAAVAVACDGAVWESEEGRVLARYRALPPMERARHTRLAHAAASLRKEEGRLARARRRGLSSGRALAPWHGDLEGMSAEGLQELLGSLDAAVLAAEERRKALGAAAVLPPAGQDGDVVPVVADGVEDMDAWIAELMWDGDEPLTLNSGTVQQSGSSSTSSVQTVTGGGETYQLQMLGNGGDHGNGCLTGGYQYQFQPRDAMVLPASGLPCTGSFNVAMHGFQSNANAHGGWSNLAMVAIGHCQWPCNALAPIGQYSSLNVASGSAYTQTFQAGDYDYCVDTNGLQVQAPGNGVSFHGAWPDLAMWDIDQSSRDAVVPVGYHPLDVAGGRSANAPAAAHDNFVGAPAIGTDANAYEYGAQYFAGGDFRCAGPSQRFGIEQLRYLGDLPQVSLF